MSEPGHKTLPDLDEHSVDPDPIKQFTIWFDDALRQNVPQADAMVLATASAVGTPSARVVLLKHVDDRGFVFFTNYTSRKGRELESNPKAALVFLWPGVHRQVRIEGTVVRISPEESDGYFVTRPRDGQLSSLASTQSEPIGSRGELDRRYDELKHTHEGGSIPRPPSWGGYRVWPETMEFWQARFARLNDRVLYTRQEKNRWNRIRLQP